MKKNLLLLIVVTCLAFYYYLEHDRPDAKRVLRVGMECDFVPNNWEEERPSETNCPLANIPGHYAEGYDLQIAKAVAKELDADLIVVKIAWEDLLNALNRREIDAIFSGMVDSKEYKAKADFSDVYDVQKTEYAIMVRKDGRFSNAKTIVDFKGATLLGQKATRLDHVIKQIPEAHHLPAVDTVPAMIDALRAGQPDGIIINIETGEAYENLHPDLRLIRFPADSGFELGFTGVCVGVRKTDTDLLNGINNAIRNISIRQRKRIMDQTIARVWAHL